MVDNPLRLLVVRPPVVPTYFNAGHHLPVFSVSAYLRRSLGRPVRVDALDAAALNMTWKELADRLWPGDGDGTYDVVACMNDLGDGGAVGQFVERARALQPGARLVTFGRFSTRVPAYFQRYDLDGIVASGDYETGLSAFVAWTEDPGRPTPGVAVRPRRG